MKESSSSEDLKNLLEAIKAAEVVESRIKLLCDLEELDITEKCEVASLIGALTKFWEDFTCLDVSQCMLNKAILGVAAKYLNSDITGCMEEFLGLAIKASSWSRKHLKMTLMSTNESPEEEHSELFYQLLLDVLSYSTASFSALARNSISKSMELMLTTENFIQEQLNLIKDSLLDTKRINTVGTEIQKAAQMLLDAAIRLCKVYSNGVNLDVCSARSGEFGKATGNEVDGHVDHVMNIAKHTIEKLCEVGILAAKGGGSLVSVLNMSWKGVVTVLQLCRGCLATKVNVAGVIHNLISLANDSLRHSAQTWTSQLKEAVSAAEAKRTFLPVKFFLINAVRIITQYPTETISISKEVAECAILISTLKIYFSLEELLKAASKELVDTLGPTSFHLLNSIFNSTQVKEVDKFQFLDWLFGDEGNFSSIHGASTCHHDSNSVIEVFFTNSFGITGEKMLVVGQISLFLDLLKSSSDLENDVKLRMTRRLPWLLDMLTDEEIYSVCLVLQVPIPHGSNQKQEFDCEPFLHFILNSLKTFMILMSSSPAWDEIEIFLLENIFHPHLLCAEIVTELWNFMLRHAEADVGNDIIEKLCSLLRCTASTETLLDPCSALRKLARFICTLVSYGSESLADRVYISATGDNNSQHSSVIYTALLMEGFQLNSLPERTRSMAKQKVVTEYFVFLERFGTDIPRVGSFELYGAPVSALCAALQSQQISISDTEMKTLEFLLAIMHKYKESTDKEFKNMYCRKRKILEMENHKPENVAFEGGDGLSMVVELPLGVAAATFNLEKAVCSHGLFMMAPNYWDSQSKTLQRPLRLSLDFDDPKYQTSLTVKIAQPADSSHSLFIEVFGTDSLSPLQCQVLLDQVKRMLRLSEEDEKNVKEFQEIYGEAKEKGFGRVFRSPTLFEDMVKCILLCNCQWSRTLSMARSLCELQWEIQHQSSIVSPAKTDLFIPKTPAGKESKKKHGVKKCSRNLTNKFLQINSVVKEVIELDPCEPCRTSIEGTCWGSRIGNFPSPKELASLDETFLAKRCNLGYRAGRILKFAQNVVEGKIQLRALEEVSRRSLNMSSYDELLEQLKGINGFGPYTSANVLMCMGFYHIIPTDSETIRHLRQVHAKHSTMETVQKEIEEIYGKYAPFQFLAYWSEVWQFYEEWFGKSSEMDPACYKLITAANMRPEKKGKSKKIKICIS